MNNMIQIMNHIYLIESSSIIGVRISIVNYVNSLTITKLTTKVKVSSGQGEIPDRL